MANLFSKEMQDQLKQLKTELGKGRSQTKETDENGKPTETVGLLSKQQVAKQVKKYNSEHLDDDKLLFMQAMSGVQPIKDKNLADKNNAGNKLDATTLAKRAAAVGGDDDSGHVLSDMQALLNPVSGDAYLVIKPQRYKTKCLMSSNKAKFAGMMP